MDASAKRKAEGVTADAVALLPPPLVLPPWCCPAWPPLGGLVTTTECDGLLESTVPPGAADVAVELTSTRSADDRSDCRDGTAAEEAAAELIALLEGERAGGESAREGTCVPLDAVEREESAWKMLWSAQMTQGSP